LVEYVGCNGKEGLRNMVIADRFTRAAGRKTALAGDIEKRTGLLRCYISRVENGHTVPAIETLEKMARALEVPMYQLLLTTERSRRSYRASQAETV